MDINGCTKLIPLPSFDLEAGTCHIVKSSLVSGGHPAHHNKTMLGSSLIYSTNYLITS